jgi:site-specific DNA-methyltransferase (adenine-specific)
MPRREYERFTFDWIDGCIDCLAPHGSIFINIPDDTAAECVMHLKRRGLTMINWCIWHFRFGQHRESSFIMSKVHVLYFAKDSRVRTFTAENAESAEKKSKKNHSAISVSSAVNPFGGGDGGGRIWNPDEILELSDRASIYADPRTMAKDTNKGMRVPMDVWYGKYWGRIQGNNAERRHYHDNQIPEVYLERVIRACSREGDLVMDPFVGSGTTPVVARELNRRFIGTEFSKQNAKSAWERITEIGCVRVKRDTPTQHASAIFQPRPTRKTSK